MAALLPFLSEILPMIMPAAAHVTRASDLEPLHPTVEGPVIRRTAVVNKSDKLCASDAIVYAVSGTGILTVKEGFEAELRHHELNPGDFAVIPAWTEHQVRNETEADVVWVFVQSGPRPVGAELADWGGDEAANQD